MNWLKKAYQDKGTRQLTIFIAVIGPLWAGLSYWIDPTSGTWWQAWAFFWTGYVVIVLPLLYFNRNNP